MERELGSTADIRELNQELLVAVLRKQQCASVAELARYTNLSGPTCVKILNDLIGSGTITELEERAFGGGRPARRYRYNPQNTLIAALILRITVDENKIIHFVADSTGRIIDSATDIVSAIDCDHLDASLAALKKTFPAIKAVSVSVPGMVSNGVVGSGDAALLSGIALEKHIRQKHGLVATVENDMNFAAIGFHRCQQYQSQAGLLYLLFPRGYCTGGGLVINDRLVCGKSGFAGELSYINCIATREHVRNIIAAPHKRQQFLRYIAKNIIAAIAMVNPGTVVLSGDDIQEDMHDALTSLCLDAVPPEHMPDIILRNDYHSDCLAGMIVLALSSLTRYPQLLEFAPLDKAQ